MFVCLYIIKKFPPLMSNILMCLEVMDASTVRGANPHHDTQPAASPAPAALNGPLSVTFALY